MSEFISSRADSTIQQGAWPLGIIGLSITTHDIEGMKAASSRKNGALTTYGYIVQ